uniref:T-box domain-containing protein n=1 Tax=Chelydra serpentina TaxID=8475 RepID=A0A8C3TCG7_CHESE
MGLFGGLNNEHVFLCFIQFSHVAFPLSPEFSGRCPGLFPQFQMIPLQSSQLTSFHNEGCIPPSINGSYGRVHLSLENKALWEEFYTLGTEMIITKSGRRMFPPCKVIVSGLNPLSLYLMLVDIVPLDNARYKWHCGYWEAVGKADPHFPSHFYLHPDSPAPGSHWMKEPVSFQRLKITNNTLEQCEHITLHSMHKYQPRFHVVLTSAHTLTLPWNAVASFVFPETTFMAVTAYQNSKTGEYPHNERGLFHSLPLLILPPFSIPLHFSLSFITPPSCLFSLPLPPFPFFCIFLPLFLSLCVSIFPSLSPFPFLLSLCYLPVTGYPTED